MFRGTAAFLVLAAHWRMLIFVDGSYYQHLSVGLYFFYWATKLGHQAVVIFFVLSGFLVGRTVLRPVWSGRWSAKRYLLHRLIRLEIVLVPALVLCWLLDSAGSHFFHPSAVYMGTAGLVAIPYSVLEHLKPHIFLGNIAFLQTIYVPTFGSDDVLWSLTNEFWYYVLFPCIVISLTTSFRWLQRGSAFVLFASLLLFFKMHDGEGILRGFLVWLLGAGLAVIPSPAAITGHMRRIGMASAALLLLLQVVLTYAPAPFNLEKGGFPQSDLILGLIFSILMYFSLHDQLAVGNGYRRTAKFSANVSYTLYLTHMPLLVFIAAWRGKRWYPSEEHLFLGVGILVLSLAYAIAIWMLFERHTDSLRRRAEGLLGMRTE
jgi:peptidoglycan/LPS O-acetylase OafA/YrhL